MNNMGSAKQEPAQATATATATSSGAAQAQHQRARDRPPVFLHPQVAGTGRNITKLETALPDWKLRSIVAEYGLPPSVRGLHIGGSF